jgi:hypothetical protein
MSRPHDYTWHPPKDQRWRFVLPPGRPPAPAGWTPLPGWRPDPGWPPAPEGWQYWREVQWALHRATRITSLITGAIGLALIGLFLRRGAVSDPASYRQTESGQKIVSLAAGGQVPHPRLAGEADGDGDHRVVQLAHRRGRPHHGEIAAESLDG